MRRLGLVLLSLLMYPSSVWAESIMQQVAPGAGVPVTATLPLPVVNTVPVQLPVWLFTNVVTNTTTTAKTGGGTLHAIVINTKGATANTATVYDNTVGSGTKIATIDTTSAVGTLLYDASFVTGLTVVTASGTAADLSLVWK